MAKRFIDTELWDKNWFGELQLDQKMLWIYICSKCDIAGIWDKNFRKAHFDLGIQVTEASLKCFGERVVHLEDNKLLIPGFISFQYGELSEDCKPHRSVIGLLTKRGIDLKTLTPCKGYPNPSQRVQDKDKDKDKEKDKEKEEGGVGETTPPTKRKRTKKEYTPEFDVVYKQYPRQEGKADGYKIYLAEILSNADRIELSRAISNYTELCRRENREQKHIKHFGTFMGCWRDYLNTPIFAQTGGEQRVKCDACTSGLIRAISRSSGHSEWTACSCVLGKSKSTYQRFDAEKFERAS